MGHIGGVLLFYSFAAGVAVCLIFLLGKFFKFNSKYAVAFRFLHVACLWASMGVLMAAVVSNDFNVAYVSNYSDLTLPLFYKISVLWAGPEGFFFFLAAIFSAVGLVEVLRIKDKTSKYYKTLSIITTLIPLFLVALLIFVLQPFREMDFTPVNGHGLNPLLQNFSAFFYPPMWALFFASSFVVFSWALTALILKDYGIYWLRASSFWVYFMMVFMAGVIVCEGLSSFYMVALNGFWVWDIMETASVVAFVLSVAFVHSTATCLDKGRGKRLCLFLAFIVFQMGLFTIYIANSFVIGYVVAFQRPSVKIYLLVAMVISAIVFLAFFIKGYKKLRSTPSVVSRPREKAVNIALLIIFAVAFFTFLGLMTQFYGQQTGKIFFLNPSHYYSIVAPVMALCVIIMGVLALRLYRGKEYGKSLKVRYILIACVFLGILAGIFLFKINPFVAVFLWLSFLSGIFMVIYAIKVASKHTFGGLFKNGGFCTWIMAHLGFLLVVTGIVLSAFYYKEYYVETKAGDSFDVAGYNFLVSGANSLYKDNYLYTFIDISVAKDGVPFGKVSPEIRSYDNSRKLFAGVKNERFFLNELSVAFISYDFKTKDIELFVAEYPFLWLIPLGGLLLVIGTVCVAFGKRIFNG